jgi:hypothetical protein
MGCHGVNFPHDFGKWRVSTARHLKRKREVRVCKGCGVREYRARQVKR